MTNKTCPNNI